MAGSAFISYSHVDADYVNRLAIFLAEADIPVWYDRRMADGVRWTTTISRQLDECAAVVVVMTPDAESSDWVDKEITRALRLNKPILPLLLSGVNFFTLGNIQYEDVTGGAMPGAEFVTLLRSYLGGEHTTSRSWPTDERLTRELIADRIRQLGATHPEVVELRRKMASQVGATGDHREAVRLLQQLVVDQEMAKADLADTLTSQHLLCYHLGESGNRTEAAWRLRDVVAGRTRVLGRADPDTLESRHLLACNVGEAGDWAEGLRLLDQVVTDRGLNLGTKHPDTLASRHVMAYQLGKSGKWAEAAVLLRDVSTLRTTVLGANHPHTLDSRHLLGYSLGEAGDRRAAIKVLRDVVSRRQRSLGPTHNDTFLSRYSHAYNVGEAGSSREAARLLRELLDDEVRILGPEHPYTLASMRSLEFYS